MSDSNLIQIGKSTSDVNYIINNYRARKVGDYHFVTTDHGSYALLTDSEFKQLKEENISDELLPKLEEREIVLNNSNFKETIRLIRNRNNIMYSGTSLHIVVVTLRCNMNCVYCHAASVHENKADHDMSLETAKNTVDLIFQSPSNGITIEFQGGEPLLNWEVIKFIITYAKEKNKVAQKDLQFTLVTNMTMMDEEKMDHLINEDIGVCTSLDGPKEVHDYNRKFVKGSSYDHVVNWINRFNAEYKKRNLQGRSVNALVTLTKKSLSYPKEIVDQYVELGLKQIHLRFLNNLGTAKVTWGSIHYTAEEYLKFWKEAVEYLEELKDQGVDIFERMVDIMIKKINNETDPNYLELRTPCGAGIGQMTYHHNGEIYTCDEGRMTGDDAFLIGHVNENNYKEVVTSDKVLATISASINDQYTCDTCSYKPYCGLCPVCNYSETGTTIAKVSQSSRCKIHKFQFDWVVKNKFIKAEEQFRSKDG